MCHEPTDPSGHVTDLIFDLLRERLSPEEIQAVQSHIEDCADCATIFAQAEASQRDIDERGARHLGAAQLVACSEGQASIMNDAETTHLAGCAFCRRQLEWAQATAQLPEPTSDEIRDSAVSPTSELARPGGWSNRLLDRLDRLVPAPRWAWASVAAVAAAGLLIIVLTLPLDDGGELSSLARLEPIPVEWPRGPETPTGFEGLYRNGLRLYAAGDFAAATTELQRAAELEPSHEAVYLFYGSATLLAGKAMAALPLYQRAVGNSRSPALAEECSWQLANAHLAAADAPAAVILLREIAAGGGSRAADAQELLQAITSVR